MGVISPNLPDISLSEWRTKPFQERIRISAQHLADNGFGTPGVIPVLYLFRMALYVVGAAWLISVTTPGLGSLATIGTWAFAPIVVQKLVVFTILWEAVGFGGGGGPLTFRFVPPLGSITYWLRPGTIRLPPFPRALPFTRGDNRTWFDVVLYAVFLASLVWALVAPPAASTLTATGLVDPLILIVVLAVWALLGIRDQIAFLAARADQYIYWIIVSVVLTAPDIVLAGKVLLLLTWWGAGLSKLNRHFPYVVTVMMANSPALRPKALKRLLFRSYPDDLRPSKLSVLGAHFGTAVEFVAPLVLILSQNVWLTLASLILITLFHLFIGAHFPAAVPLEWNLFMIAAAWLLFWGHPNAEANVFTDFANPWLFLPIVVFIVGMIVWGALQPKYGSFLFGMRYYAGNWASSTWLMKPGIEDRIDRSVTKTAPHTVRQLRYLYSEDVAEWFVQKAVAWRSMHGQGRIHVGLTHHAVADPSAYTIREGEFVCGHLIGWNFGDGHLHDEQLLDAIQRRCQLEPGDLRVILLEGQPIHRQEQDYRIYDPAVGVIERGTVKVAEMLGRQPWLPGEHGYPSFVAFRHESSPQTSTGQTQTTDAAANS